jgi:hypothetical protein
MVSVGLSQAGVENEELFFAAAETLRFRPDVLGFLPGTSEHPRQLPLDQGRKFGDLLGRLIDQLLGTLFRLPGRLGRARFGAGSISRVMAILLAGPRSRWV